MNVLFEQQTTQRSKLSLWNEKSRFCSKRTIRKSCFSDSGPLKNTLSGWYGIPCRIFRIFGRPVEYRSGTRCSNAIDSISKSSVSGFAALARCGGNSQASVSSGSSARISGRFRKVQKRWSEQSGDCWQRASTTRMAIKCSTSRTTQITVICTRRSPSSVRSSECSRSRIYEEIAANPTPPLTNSTFSPYVFITRSKYCAPETGFASFSRLSVEKAIGMPWSATVRLCSMQNGPSMNTFHSFPCRFSRVSTLDSHRWLRLPFRSGERVRVRTGLRSSSRCCDRSEFRLVNRGTDRLP